MNDCQVTDTLAYTGDYATIAIHRRLLLQAGSMACVRINLLTQVANRQRYGSHVPQKSDLIFPE